LIAPARSRNATRYLLHDTRWRRCLLLSLQRTRQPPQQPLGKRVKQRRGVVRIPSRQDTQKRDHPDSRLNRAHVEQSLGDGQGENHRDDWGVKEFGPSDDGFGLLELPFLGHSRRVVQEAREQAKQRPCGHFGDDTPRVRPEQQEFSGREELVARAPSGPA
jgi:hypothetical protein